MHVFDLSNHQYGKNLETENQVSVFQSHQTLRLRGAKQLLRCPLIQEANPMEQLLVGFGDPKIICARATSR